MRKSARTKKYNIKLKNNSFASYSFNDNKIISQKANIIVAFYFLNNIICKVILERVDIRSCIPTTDGARQENCLAEVKRKPAKPSIISVTK